MLVGYVVCKNVSIIKLLILYVYKQDVEIKNSTTNHYIYMDNKCVVTNCTNGYATSEKKPSFFQKAKNFARNGFISLIARAGHQKKYSVVFIDHFHDKFIKHGKVNVN